MVEIKKISMIDKAADQWRRRKWLFIVCFLSVFTAVVCMVVALPPLYRSSTTILLTQDDTAESLLKTGATNEMGSWLGSIQKAVLSRTQLQEVIDAFDLYAPMRGRESPESVISRFREDIRIDQQTSDVPLWGQRSTYVITIGYQDWDPERAARVANELAARYRAEYERMRTAQALRTTEFMREELAAAKARFEVEEQRISDFKNAHMGELPEQQAFNMTTLDRLNSELRLNGERQVYLLEQRDGMLRGASEGDARMGVMGLTGSRRLEWLKRGLAELETRFTAKHPDIIRLKAEIDSLTLQLAATGLGDDMQKNLQGDLQRPERAPADLEGQLRELRSEEGRLRSAISALVRNLKGTPRIERELQRFANDYTSTGNEYAAMRMHYQDAYLAESVLTQQNQQLKIIEVAITPDGSVVPNRPRLIFIGFILAIALAWAALLLAEGLDRSFHSIGAIRQFTGVPVLANIPRVRTPEDQRRSRAQFSLLTVIVVAGLLATASSSYYVGMHADQLVLAISNLDSKSGTK